jgi:hypothetical protein
VTLCFLVVVVTLAAVAFDGVLAEDEADVADTGAM